MAGIGRVRRPATCAVARAQPAAGAHARSAPGRDRRRNVVRPEPRGGEVNSDLDIRTARTAIGGGELSPVELTDSVLARIERWTVRPRRLRRGLRRRIRPPAAAAGRGRGIAAGRTGARCTAFRSRSRTSSTSRAADRAGSRARRAPTAADGQHVAARLRDGRRDPPRQDPHPRVRLRADDTPQTGNAWARDRVAGGSSGGSAVAVAAGCAFGRWARTPAAPSGCPPR